MRRAGLSQGALFNHFTSKAELIVAAAEHLLASMTGDYRREFRGLQGVEDPVAAELFPEAGLVRPDARGAHHMIEFLIGIGRALLRGPASSSPSR